MKLFQPVTLISLGLLIVVAGFMYDIMFAGIPYQDPTPEMIQQYNFHAGIASFIRWCGFITLLLGLGRLIVKTFLKSPKIES